MSVELRSDTFAVALKRSQLMFYACFGVIVVILSFLYGISYGARSKVAVAGLPMPQLIADDGFAQSPDLPGGTRTVSLGDDVEINGQASDVTMFVSERPPTEIIPEQLAIWERKGIRAHGRSGRSRGVAIGIEKKSGKRFVFSVWSIPPQIRGQVSYGRPFQGVLAVSAEKGSLPADPDEASGLVPGVPLYPGGNAGAVFSSVGAGGRSYSSIYNNPGTLSENLEFYRLTLGSGGWNETQSSLDDDPEKGVASLILERGENELILLFTLAKSKTSDSQMRTGVSVSMGPNLSKNMGRMR